jgi:AraC-like DNA-binding protein
MPGSVVSAFGEQEDYEAALRVEGCTGLVITGQGQFRAQLTQIRLRRLRLTAAEERLSRIAFIVVPVDMTIVAFPIGHRTAPVHGGIRMQSREFMILAPAEEMHVRTSGPCRWGAIWVPVAELVRYGNALSGPTFAVPLGGQSWRPPPASARRLRSLHAAAIRMAQTRPQTLVAAQTAHGLEQELVHALVECLSAGSADASTLAARRHQEIMARFEQLVQAHPNRALRASEICAALGISERLLSSLCVEHLGMSPTGYGRLRRMSLVRCALRRAGPETKTVSKAAERYGFLNPGRFAASYRAAYGELPSATLKRGSGKR